MRLSTVLLFCLFILCCTGAANSACRRLQVFPGAVAALSLLAAAISAFSWEIVPQCSIFPASLLLIALCVCYLPINNADLVHSLLLAFVVGIFSWLIQSFVPAVYEPGVLLALPSAVAARWLLGKKSAGLLCTLLSPLFYASMVLLEDWYLFDVVQITFGSPLQFDAQVCGALLYAIFLHIPRLHQINRLATQK
ncbi:MAG: hypothetical protein RRZ24_09700 [Clostridia bacterium]